MIKYSTPSKIINLLFLLAAIACIAYYIMLGVTVRFGQSLDFMWLVFAAIFIIRFALVQQAISTGNPPQWSRILVKLIHVGLIVFLVSFIAIESLIVSAFSASVPKGLDYVIVLGAKVNGTQPGGALRNRIQVSYEYWRENPETLIIASGGQGADEGISEAQCIYNGLTARGVPPEAILLEEKSTSTAENLAYSMALISDAENKRIGIVTNNFHLYRALKIADKTQQSHYYGVNVATSPISFPHYMLREYFAALHGFVTGRW
ncbi:MAG: YdcF family protein [Clostridia bacterium]|nr:YdcF family protein [Clostridia bacterium]